MVSTAGATGVWVLCCLHLSTPQQTAPLPGDRKWAVAAVEQPEDLLEAVVRTWGFIRSQISVLKRLLWLHMENRLERGNSVCAERGSEVTKSPGENVQWPAWALRQQKAGLGPREAERGEHRG